MKTTVSAAVFTLAVAASALAQERPEDRWNLADLYPDLAAWNADAAKVEAQLPQIAACKGKLGESARRFKECMDLQYDALKRYYRLAVYSGELQAEDTGNAESLALAQRTRVLGSKFTEAGSFVRPEILALGKSRIDTFFRDEPGIAIYRQPVRRTLDAAPHTLDGPGEAIVASFALAARQSGSIYNIFANADMPWPTVKLSDGT